MAENKTQKTTASVAAFIKSIADDQRRKDCKEVVAMMTKATGAKPAMWGPAIIGFGDHEYFGASVFWVLFSATRESEPSTSARIADNCATSS